MRTASSFRVCLFSGALTLAAASLGSSTSVLAQQELPTTGPFASVDFPPSGQRLRDLADRLPIDIGFAARRDWPNLPEAAAYEAIARAEFNILTPESSFKWLFVHPQEDQFDFSDLDREVSFAESSGMRLHGHPLTWYLLNPPWLDAAPAERLPAILENHVETVVSRYAGRFQVWDVVNEGLNNEGSDLRDDVWANALGTSYMDIAFNAAREADPNATLLYNDFNIGWLTPKSARALALVDELLARSVPVDGIGMQMHLDHTFSHFEGHSVAMQRFADRGLDVYITELDVGVLQVEDYLVQADVYEEAVRRCLMQPACKAVQIWGLNDRTSWRPFFRPLPYDEVTRVKPAYFGLQRGLMTQPVHPEQCELEAAVVMSGSVRSDSNTGNAFGVRCSNVSLQGGFERLSIRYRNPGTDTPTLSVRAGDAELASLALPPVPMTDDGDFTTIDVTIPAVNESVSLSLSVSAVSDDSAVAVDALLFGDPSLPLPPGSTDGTTDASDAGMDTGTGSDGDTGTRDDGSTGGETDTDGSTGGETGADGSSGTDTGTNTTGGSTTSGSTDGNGDGSSRRSGGGFGSMYASLLALALVLVSRRRSAAWRRRQVSGAGPTL